MPLTTYSDMPSHDEASGDAARAIVAPQRLPGLRGLLAINSSTIQQSRSRCTEYIPSLFWTLSFTVARFFRSEVAPIAPARDLWCLMTIDFTKATTSIDSLIPVI